MTRNHARAKAAGAVIGIDPSITATGIAVDGNHWTITTKAGDPYRLETIHAAVDLTLAAPLGVDLAVIEDLPTHAHGAGATRPRPTCAWPGSSAPGPTCATTTKRTRSGCERSGSPCSAPLKAIPMPKANRDALNKLRLPEGIETRA